MTEFDAYRTVQDLELILRDCRTGHESLKNPADVSDCVKTYLSNGEKIMRIKKKKTSFSKEDAKLLSSLLDSFEREDEKLRKELISEKEESKAKFNSEYERLLRLHSSPEQLNDLDVFAQSYVALKKIDDSLFKRILPDMIGVYHECKTKLDPVYIALSELVSKSMRAMYEEHESVNGMLEQIEDLEKQYVDIKRKEPLLDKTFGDVVHDLKWKLRIYDISYDSIREKKERLQTDIAAMRKHMEKQNIVALRQFSDRSPGEKCEFLRRDVAAYAAVCGEATILIKEHDNKLEVQRIESKRREDALKTQQKLEHERSLKQLDVEKTRIEAQKTKLVLDDQANHRNYVLERHKIDASRQIVVSPVSGKTDPLIDAIQRLDVPDEKSYELRSILLGASLKDKSWNSRLHALQEKMQSYGTVSRSGQANYLNSIAVLLEQSSENGVLSELIRYGGIRKRTLLDVLREIKGKAYDLEGKALASA